MAAIAVLLLLALGSAAQEKHSMRARQLAKAIVEALQDPGFEQELLWELRKENQLYPNRTTSVLVKYIVKREVDNYRARRTDAISRRVYSALVMKLIDIAKDSPRNTSATSRIDEAHRYYSAAERRDMHDKMADAQVFHACSRLYDIMYTTPRILAQLGPLDDLTPKILLRKLQEMDIKPVHLGVALVIQYYLRNAVNYSLQSRAIEVLATKPEAVGAQVVNTLKALAARLLPVSELLDVHLAHSSTAFKDTSPSTWLGIVNNK